MNIGFVSYWFERGAAYVTRQYMDLLKDDNNIFVYVRGGEYAIGNPIWDLPYVTWGMHGKEQSDIIWYDFKKWIKRNKIDIIFFNEQRAMDALIKTREVFPSIVLGAYVDYYRMDTVRDFAIYDFLICNTKRHYEVFDWHSNCYYIPWGTNVDLFSYVPDEHVFDGKIKFFHSMGMSDRKGIHAIMEVFLESDLHNLSELIVHTQSNCCPDFGYTKEELKKRNVTIIDKTVTAPGLYSKGDVYVYPTILDGLGLSVYEALSCGLPVIGTNVPPINEVINEENGRLVDVEAYKSREDGYYWPNSYVNKESLYKAMMFYVENSGSIKRYRDKAREVAVAKYNWNDRKKEINKIFCEVKPKLFSKVELDSFRIDKSIGNRIDEIIAFIKLNYLKKYV